MLSSHSNSDQSAGSEHSSSDAPRREVSDLTVQPDVLVIGGGTAALCAAISARRAGASVWLLEQAPKGLRGGNTRHSRNLRFMHEQTSPLTTGPYPEAEFWRDLATATEGATDQRLARTLIRGSADVTDWLTDAGVHFQRPADGGLPPSRKTAFLLGGGKAMLNALYRTAERLGVTIGYDCEVSEIRLDAGRVESVAFRHEGATQRLRPGSLIACCGGAQANREWLRDQWGKAADRFINRGTPFATGTVLHSLLRQGAAPVGDSATAYLVAVDARSPADDGGIVTRVRCMPSGIVVDAQALRMHDEGGDTASTRYALWGQRLARCPGQTAYLILDAGAQREAPPSLYPPLAEPSLAGLAERLGLDPIALQRTVADYNAATRPPSTGSAPAGWHTQGLEPPKSRHAMPLVEPPFSAYPMRPGITFTYQGLTVDEHTRVRMIDGANADNLFAAGMIMAPNLVGRGYISGLALTIGIVFGCIAGEEAARRAMG